MAGDPEKESKVRVSKEKLKGKKGEGERRQKGCRKTSLLEK